jgi:tetratricopeptide (TPR) repeat protein
MTLVGQAASVGTRIPAPASRRAALAIVTLMLAVGSACAPKTPPVTPGPARFPDFVYPAVPAAFERQANATRRHDDAWRFLQAGDLRQADRSFSAALQAQPDFYPALAGAGYVALAQRDYREALGHFDAALKRAPAYAPALAGRGEALLGLGRDADAVVALEAAVAADPSLAQVQRRVEALRFRGVEQRIAQAQAAARAGRLDDARAAYAQAIAASPDSAFLYREAAEVERRLGRDDEALAHAREAVAHDPSDGASELLLGELLEARGDWQGALVAYEAARRLDAAPDIADRIDRVKERAALAALPEEYRAIPDSPRVTRGELAALLGVRLEPFVRASRRNVPTVATDIRGYWAQTWILNVVRAGFMEIYPNHTFQPGAPVRRSDLAQAVSRVLATVAARDPAAAAAWRDARGRFSDLSAGNLNYRAASTAVAAGVMRANGDGAFDGARFVTGADAVEVVDRLERIVQGIKTGPPR